MSTAEECLRFSSLFEAELLLELMLRYWKHPLAHDREFRQTVIEDAAEALQHSVDGEALMEGMAPDEFNFVAAVYYVEWRHLSDNLEEEQRPEREVWLKRLRRALPSCFCRQDDLA